MAVFTEIFTRNISKLYYADNTTTNNNNNSRLANLKCKTENTKKKSILTGVVNFLILEFTIQP